MTSAQNSVAAGDASGACSTLDAFVHEVEAQSGKKIAKTLADSLIAQAKRIRAVLGC